MGKGEITQDYCILMPHEGLTYSSYFNGEQWMYNMVHSTHTAVVHTTCTVQQHDLATFYAGLTDR